MPAKILVVDDVEDILEILAFYVEDVMNGAQVLRATSGNAAIELIDKTPDLDIVICDYNMPNGNGGLVYSHLRKVSQIPFILHTSDSVNTHTEFASATAFQHLPKPCQFPIFEQMIKSFLKDKNVRTKEQISFVGIGIVLLRKIESIVVPLYVKIGDDNFVKVSHEKHVFDDAEFLKYKNKNVDRLYIERHFFSQFNADFQSRIFDKINEAIQTANADSLQVARASLDFLEKAQEQFGLTPEVQALTNKNIEMVLSLLDKNPDFAPILESWKAGDDELYANRASLIALLSTSIAKKLKWVSDFTSQKLAFAALLHDIALTPEQRENQTAIIEEVRSTKSSKNEASLKDFKRHPTVGCDIVKKWPHCPPDVEIIIAQHHESADGTGFPNQLNHTRISPLSCVFIVAQDIADFIIANGGKKQLSDWIAFRKEHYDRGEFKKIFASLI